MSLSNITDLANQTLGHYDMFKGIYVVENLGVVNVVLAVIWLVVYGLFTISDRKTYFITFYAQRVIPMLLSLSAWWYRTTDMAFALVLYWTLDFGLFMLVDSFVEKSKWIKAAYVALLNLIFIPKPMPFATRHMQDSSNPHSS